ncbi:ABC transporter permease [Streptomyces sp. NPDC002088]|uniref:ABC transporter permease n=1 Tax=Streptomyces sp. NPDC002088 TaxID=3154665 RepID=UPI00332A3B07
MSPSPGRTKAQRVRRLLTRWVLGPALTVLVASLAVFTALSLAPGDPVGRLLGARATDAQRATLRHELGLDEPVPVRYVHWLADCLHGNFGSSVVYLSPVSDLLGARLTTTLFLVSYAAVLVIVIGLLLGILGAVFRPLGPVTAAISGLGIAVPSYVAASALVTVFALDLGWFPTLGAGSGFGDRLWHLTLPAAALAVGWSAYVAQITRTALREEQTREHVETALGRGVPPALVFRRHILRNAAIPIITVTGTLVAGLVAGTVVVETAFGIDGIGSFLVTSVQGKDYNVVMAISLLLVLLFVLVTTVIDSLQRVLDPRIRERRPA